MLSASDRFTISKKLVEIPKQNNQADTIKSQLESKKTKAAQQDIANQNLMDSLTTLINIYQTEHPRYSGITRTTLAEQDLIDSANRTHQNYFFPNDPNTPLPDISSGVWKQFTSFSANIAIGKTYLEVYPGTSTKEQDLIDDVNAKIAVVESFSDVTRSTGQKCISTGTCSLPAYTDEATCVAHSGVWTPGPDSIVTDTDMQTAGDDLKTSIQNWLDFMNATYPLIATSVQDSNATRLAGNDAARADITNADSIIATWQSKSDFDPTTGYTTCISFNSIDVSTLSATKFRATDLQYIKDEITARESYVSSRISELDTYLGGITQDFGTGSISATSGLYGSRFRLIETRLNVMNGSLTAKTGLERAQGAQDQLKNSNSNTQAAYSTVMVATAFMAPAGGTSVIHVLDASGFSVSDSIYVVSDVQPEISGTISNIVGNSVYLSIVVSKNYQESDNARLYKLL